MATRVFNSIRKDKKGDTEYYYHLYKTHFNHLGGAADQNLSKRINIKYSEYMVRKYVKEKE